MPELDSTSEVEPDPNEPLNLQSMGRDTGRRRRSTCLRKSKQGKCLVCCQQFGFHPNFFERCDRQGMLNYKVLKDETPCAVAVSKGVAGERIVSGEQRDTGEGLPSTPAESSLLETTSPPSRDYILHTATPPSFLSYVDRSADGPRTAEPRPARSLLWQKSCLVRKKRHSSTSPAVASKCDGMLGEDGMALRDSGSLHWSLKENGMLCEDRCKNCLTVDEDPETGKLAVKIVHCKNLMPLSDANANLSSIDSMKPLVPLTRIVAKTLPLAEIDYGQGPPMVTSVCEFSDRSSSEDVVIKDREYINDLWPMQARASYCASHRATCVFNPRSGQCRPRRRMEAENSSTVSNGDLPGSDGLPDNRPSDLPPADIDMDFSGGCQSAVDETPEGHPVCPVCLGKYSISSLSGVPTTPCMYCAGGGGMQGMCMSQLDVVALFESGMLLKTVMHCTSQVRSFLRRKMLGTLELTL